MVDVERIERIFQEYYDYHKNSIKIDPVTGIVNVYGDVSLVKNTPTLILNFGQIKGSFTCSHANLKTLHGAPKTVAGNFDCRGNQLESLQGSPAYVVLAFDCSNNFLLTLEHGPSIVGHSFYCQKNKLTTLVGAPDHVTNFICDDNPLQSLDGAPKQVRYTFELSYDPELPLLRLCMFKHFSIRRAPDPVREILKKYQGTGRPGALKAAAELIRAGYAENARW